jgi:3-methyl-2-oxobutanoate hydroxymethyltransferase
VSVDPANFELRPREEPVTLRTLRRMAREKHPFACLAVYDATMACWLERAGVHVLLMGDSAAQVVLGLEKTTQMPLDVSVALTAAVKRGAPNTLVIADMPFLSYQVEESEAIRNAGRFLTEGLADVLKLEIDASYAPLVERLTRAGIPVCGHIGLRPQQAGLVGGYSSSGKTAADARRIVEDARALERAGCVLLLIEAAPPEVADRVVAETNVPVIGIGAGEGVHGQILVAHDLLGLTDRQPGFAKPIINLGEHIRDSVSDWTRRVAERRSVAHRYEMRPGEAEKLA